MKGSFIKRLSVAKRTAEVTGLSLRTINQIHQEYASIDGQFRCQLKDMVFQRIRINPDSFDKKNNS